ncbi:MAG: GSCFA domain-containing protein [Polyangiaceae bacterium]|nr:GSCFA domain-containing protein [Polyangiaceae bacterium]
MGSTPYSDLPDKSFWRPGVALRHFIELQGLARMEHLTTEDAFATAGSCFAQHIGRHLQERGLRYLDLEPAPDCLSDAEARRHGFGLYSCRYGNIYSARQLNQLALEALGKRTPVERVWEKDGRYFDALRPSVDPVGHASEEDVLCLREEHLVKVRQLLEQVNVFVFTLGLTESWQLVRDGTVYPTAPGTLAGEFTPAKYSFVNQTYPDILTDLKCFWSTLRGINPSARMVLTVSPVPLTATAGRDHVLVATTYSKSTLRAVAGDMAATEPGVSYFPSYEIIASHPSRGMFFNPDLRTVNKAGVDLVMRHFFESIDLPGAAPTGAEVPVQVSTKPLAGVVDNGVICDEESIERFAHGSGAK